MQERIIPTQDQKNPTDYFEDLENISHPHLQKIISINKQIHELLQKRWQYEASLMGLEQEICTLEQKNKINWQEADREKIYPEKYKKMAIRPTDFKEIKLEELRKRIEYLLNTKNKSEPDNETVKLQERYEAFKYDYLATLERLQENNKQLNEFCKKIFNDEKSRYKLICDIKEISPEQQLNIYAFLPGGMALTIIIDILTRLKKMYETAAQNAFFIATGKNYTKTIEELFQASYKIAPKPYFKHFAKKPTDEMPTIKEELDKVVAHISEKQGGLEHKDEQEYEKFLAYCKTLIYIACTLETFKFTDKVQKLDIATAITGKLGSFFGGEDIAGEFISQLTAVQIQNSFAVMPHAASQIALLDQANPMWLEIALLLRGLHQRSYLQIPPQFKLDGMIKENVLLNLNDHEDRQFFEHKPPLVKWTLAQYHGDHYKTIIALIPSPLFANLKPYLSELKSACKNIPSPIENKKRDTESDIQAVENDHDKKEEQIFSTSNKHSPALFTTSKKITFTASLQKLEWLNHENIGNLGKFVLYMKSLRESELSNEQNELILAMKDPMIRILTHYRDAPFTSYGFPTVIVARKHLREVKETLEIIDQTAKPVQYLFALYDLWLSASSDNSTDIGPKIEKILEDIFGLLREASKPLEKQNRI